MEVKKLPDKREVNMIKMVEVDGVEFEAEELNGLLEALEEVDGLFNAVTIYKESLRKSLEKMKIIATNGRGSSFVPPKAPYSKNFKELKKLLEDILYEDD
jgi:hypothetical protein